MVSLKTKVETLGGVYKRYSNSLRKLNILTLEDLIFHIPFRYEDYQMISSIKDLQPGETVTIKGIVKEIGNNYLRSYRTIQKAIIEDDTGQIETTWFNQPYLTKNIPKGSKISLSGTVNENRGKLVMQSPEYEMSDKDFIHTGRLVPIYPQTRGVSSKWIRKEIWKILNDTEIDDFLPSKIKGNNKLLDLKEALFKVHFPEKIEEVDFARKRLSFDELFIAQLGSLRRKKEWNKNRKGTAMKVNKIKISEFVSGLPFELTKAQQKASDEILNDISKKKPMNRLLQGDVGSGKTIVAAIAIYSTFLNGYKSIFMAPTEILANQHYETLTKLLSLFGIKIGLQTSTKKIKGEDVIVGTHSLIHLNKTEKLGLAVIDEQQRFGVEQRSILRTKGNNPHVLTMTATPIPRTVALTIYGDLDLSVLDEMPKGRKTIKTWLIPDAKREDAYAWIKREIKTNKSQAFIICPFIEESESLVTVKAATKEFERLSRDIFPSLKLGLIHGKIKSQEKDEVLSKFQAGKLDILVATPVVEVGIDIPGASIIVIEAAERFGLAQLHQLRGRVGRRGQDAYCLLFSESKSSTQRLRYMEKTNIGSELAEYDLKLRGAGEIYGTAQHGTKYFKIADFSDFNLIRDTKNEAEKMVNELEKYPLLETKVSELNTSQVSPD